VRGALPLHRLVTRLFRSITIPPLYRDMGMVMIDLWGHLTDLRRVPPRSSMT
jgi:hypothetical protein